MAFFQLQFNIIFGNKDIWTIHYPLEDYGLDFNNDPSLRGYLNFIKTPFDYGSFLGYELGFDEFFRHFLYAAVIMPLYVKFVDPDMVISDICSMIYFDQFSTEFLNCMAAKKHSFIQ